MFVVDTMKITTVNKDTKWHSMDVLLKEFEQCELQCTHIWVFFFLIKHNTWALGHCFRMSDEQTLYNLM